MFIWYKIYSEIDMVNLLVGSEDSGGHNGLLVHDWLNDLGDVWGSVWTVHWHGVWLCNGFIKLGIMD